MNDAPSPLEHPASVESIGALRADVDKVWRRIAKRAPEAVRVRVEEALAQADALVSSEAPSLKERLAIARVLEELGGELRGRAVFEPSFYTEGRLALIRAYDPILIQGAIDHLRVERFFERYLRRAEAAFERLEYFFGRAGLLQPKEKPKKPAWEQPYAQFEQYHELIWGKMKKTASTPPTGRKPPG